MDLQHSSNIKVILCKFAKDHCFWTLWTLYYVDCVDSFHTAHNQAKYLKKVFSQILEKHDHLSVCLSTYLWHVFLKINLVVFLFFFFSTRTFCHMYKKVTKLDLENYICCLDNWVNEANLDQKQNICHFNEADLILFVLNDTL